MQQASLISSPKIIDFAEVPDSLQEEARAMILQALSTSKSDTNPKLIHLCGIPASGKTTYAHKSLSSYPNFALVGFDNVMTNLTGYKQDCATNGLVAAFKTWELPARAIGYHLLQALLENKRNVFFDHSASFRDHLNLIETAKGWGYVVEMHHLECSATVALKRLSEREAKIQRYTPEHYVFDRLKLLEELIPLYQKKVDVFRTINTATNKP